MSDRTWQDAFDRHIQEGEQAMGGTAPVARRRIRCWILSQNIAAEDSSPPSDE